MSLRPRANSSLHSPVLLSEGSLFPTSVYSVYLQEGEETMPVGHHQTSPCVTPLRPRPLVTHLTSWISLLKTIWEDWQL